MFLKTYETLLITQAHPIDYILSVRCLRSPGVLPSIFGLSGDRSLLVITHRLVGLDAMDEILVLDQGRVVERGRQFELMRAGSLYRRMWDLQSQVLQG